MPGRCGLRRRDDGSHEPVTRVSQTPGRQPHAAHRVNAPIPSYGADPSRLVCGFLMAADDRAQPIGSEAAAHWRGRAIRRGLGAATLTTTQALASDAESASRPRTTAGLPTLSARLPGSRLAVS